ncbi:unnamed protein product [Brachionus calyciflorus]|uniref:Uncharacterized protein n=1 Tax=Brachionus calyciflorus TaxID=104777 RepID=A0A813YLX5_9BILA|nr:unnamed protein product [Brachionus calyciflorus]
MNFDQENMCEFSEYYQLQKILINEITTLSKIEKWAKKLRDRIEENSMKMNCLESDSLLMTQKHRMVKQKFISKMNPTFIKYKNRMTKRIAEIQHRNKRKDKISNEKDDKSYEEMYESNYYDVSIFGKDLDKFSNIYERMDEIKRCTGVTRFEMIRPVMEKNSSKIVKLIIRVNNYKDFKLLTGEFILDSLISGVKTQANVPKLKILIFNIDRKIKIHQGSTMIKKKSDDYCLFNIKRIFTHGNKPCDKFVAKSVSIRQILLINEFNRPFWALQ